VVLFCQELGANYKLKVKFGVGFDVHINATAFETPTVKEFMGLFLTAVTCDTKMTSNKIFES